MTISFMPAGILRHLRSIFTGVWHLVAPDFTYPGVLLTSEATQDPFVVLKA